MNITIVDYNSGNISSVINSFSEVAKNNVNIEVTSDLNKIKSTDKVILPGVGSFNDCLNGLKSNKDLFYSLSTRVLKEGVPFLGICVGLQLLADYGHENIINTPGLGWLGGEVTKIYSENKNTKIPHMGWNSLLFDKEHKLTKKITSEDDMYFVHSFHIKLKDISDRLAYVNYSGELTAIVAKDNICGTQFHPEKSQKVGQIFIENFMNWSP